jgi:hypothetical protein
MERSRGRSQPRRKLGKSPAIRIAVGAEHNGKGWKVNFGELGRDVHRPKPRWRLSESYSRAGGHTNDTSGIVGVSNHRATETDLAATPNSLPSHPDGTNVMCRIKDVEGVGHRSGDDLAVFPPASFRRGDGKGGCHDPADPVAHVRTQTHGVGIDLLIEGPTEVPIGNKSLRAHQLPKALPILLLWPISDVTDRRKVKALWFAICPHENMILLCGEPHTTVKPLEATCGEIEADGS